MTEPDLKARAGWPARALAVAFLAVFALVVLTVWRAIFTQKEIMFIDLAYYRSALAAVDSGQPLFDVLGYPPITLVLLAPLGVLPDNAGNVLWTAGTMVLGVGLLALLRRLASEAGRDDLPDSKGWSFVAGSTFGAVLLMLSLPMVNHLQCGQISLLVLTLVFADASGVVPRKFQGVLTGLAGALKLTPLIMLPYYLATGQRRQAALATGSFAVATGIGFALYPSDSVAFWTRLGATGRFGDLSRPDNLSMLGTLSRWVPDADLQRMLWYVFGAVLGIAALTRARRHFQRGQLVEGALVMGSASVALSPVSWPHHQIWLVLIAVWLIWSPSAWERLLGLLIYLPYIFLYVEILVASGRGEDLAMRLAAEVPALVPAIIGLVGLPAARLPSSAQAGHRPPLSEPASAESRALADPAHGS